LFIPDPDPDFLPIPDLGVKKAPDPGSGSTTLRKILLTFFKRASSSFSMWLSILAAIRALSSLFFSRLKNCDNFFYTGIKTTMNKKNA
jgi:hypothetical protein